MENVRYHGQSGTANPASLAPGRMQDGGGQKVPIFPSSFLTTLRKGERWRKKSFGRSGEEEEEEEEESSNYCQALKSAATKQQEKSDGREDAQNKFC